MDVLKGHLKGKPPFGGPIKQAHPLHDSLARFGQVRTSPRSTVMFAFRGNLMPLTGATESPLPFSAWTKNNRNLSMAALHPKKSAQNSSNQFNPGSNQWAKLSHGMHLGQPHLGTCRETLPFGAFRTPDLPHLVGSKGAETELWQMDKTRTCGLLEIS